MTAQGSDTVIYQGTEYHLAGVTTEQGLFGPAEHGIKPRYGAETACMRGYLCAYLVQDCHLYLDTLTVYLQWDEVDRALHGEGPLLFGKLPQETSLSKWLGRRKGGSSGLQWEYRELHRPIIYSGGLLLGREFIQALYVHMGFHRAWKYREVHQLIFEAGLLVDAFDRSAAMEDIRKNIGPRDLRPGPEASKQEIDDWVTQSFSRIYQRQE